MNRRMFWGSLVILIGLILLLEASGIVTGNIWRYFWAVLLILVGLGILIPEK